MNGPELSKMERQIRDALDRLPDTADGIAEYFEEIGIKGDRNAGTCPVARYLTGEVEGIDGHIAVCSKWIFAGPHLQGGVCDLPDAVAEFIPNFDNYDYPHLVERSGS